MIIARFRNELPYQVIEESFHVNNHYSYALQRQKAVKAYMERNPSYSLLALPRKLTCMLNVKIVQNPLSVGVHFIDIRWIAN